MDPLTTTALQPSSAKLDTYADFLKLREQVLEPFNRKTGPDLSPASVLNKNVYNTWTDFDANFHSKWQMTISGAGITLRDGRSATPGFALGNAVVVAKYLKRGRIVYVRLRVTLGSSSQWSNLVLQADGVTRYGDIGDVYIDLPIQAGADARIYGLGTIWQVSTKLTALSVPFQTDYAQVSTISNAFSQKNAIVRPAATEFLFAAFSIESNSPLVYNALNPGATFTQPGDYADLFLKYETDLDD